MKRKDLVFLISILLAIASPLTYFMAARTMESWTISLLVGWLPLIIAIIVLLLYKWS